MDEDLRAEIKQDVERCMPENHYFRQPDTQRLLLVLPCPLKPTMKYCDSDGHYTGRSFCVLQT